MDLTLELMGKAIADTAADLQKAILNGQWSKVRVAMATLHGLLHGLKIALEV